MSNLLQQRFILINVVPHIFNKQEADEDLDELRLLVSTFGGASIVHVIQKRDQPDKHSFVGRGKLEEVVELVKKEKIDIVVVNAVVNPTQLFEIEKAIWEVNTNIKVWDRVDLILNIFDKHAKTTEAKLQIELARMRHMGPKIYGLGMVMSRQGGGIGTRGLGETNTELMKRHWRDAIKKNQDTLKKLSENHQRQIENRREMGMQTVSIVGYTNAGKSSLFNYLTKKKKLVENALFATLDSTVGEVYIPGLDKKILVSDTIGFIQKLPTKLIEAFKSTLIESVYADILIHVIDINDPKMKEKIEVVETVLRDLDLQQRKIYVFNKIDEIDKNNPEQLKRVKEIIKTYEDYHPQLISVKTGEGVEELINELKNML